MPAENPFRALKNTLTRVNEPSFLEETKKTWAGIYPTPISDEDAREIAENMSVFINLLINWDVATHSPTIESTKKSPTHPTQTFPPTGPANV